MFASIPPVAAVAGSGIAGPAVRLVRAGRREFAGPAGFLADPIHRYEMGRYLSDMVGAYGLRLREDVYDGRAVTADLGHSYGEMAAELIDATVPADEPVDLLVLAFAIHDVRPGRATATYLSHVCPGTPMAFAVCDQGSAAPYTALRLIREYLLAGASTRALLLVVEHGGLPYEPVSYAPVPAAHAGVALLLEPATDRAGPRLGPVRQYADLPPSRVDALLPDQRRLVRGTVERPHTGAWWAVPDTAGPATLVDYDAQLRCLSLVDIDD